MLGAWKRSTSSRAPARSTTSSSRCVSSSTAAGRLAPIEVTTQGSTVALPHAIELDADDLIEVPSVVQPPPFEVEPDAMEVRSPIGVLQAMGDAVRAMANAIGPTVVVMATFPTLPPEHALSITARGAEPLVYALGEELFELDA